MKKQFRDDISEHSKQLILRSKELIERSREIPYRVELTNERCTFRLGNSKEKSKASRPFNATSLDLNVRNQDGPGGFPLQNVVSLRP
jgi:hypothetical protein